jgi:hypothetical protein
MAGFLEGLVEKIAGVATGGLATTIFDTVKDYFPPDMSPEKKAALKLDLDKLALEKEKEVNRAVQEEADAINKRIEIYEGTAKDLLSVPIFGAIMLFLRGSQRTVWSFGAIYFDYVWLVDGKVLSSQAQTALIVINLLVLAFLFGERALKNLAPLITELLVARKG